MIVSPYPYLIFYQATEDEIVVHGVRHSARRPSSMPE
jgi:toxin ParE1/3/4